MEKQNRSRAYPAIDLEEATEALRRIPFLGLRDHTREQVAESFGYTSGSSGIAARKVAALGHFGLLQCRDKLYSPTELAKRVATASTQEDLETALRQAFMEPVLFKELVLKYEVLGRLPRQLADTLADHGITDSAKEDAAKILLRSGRYAGLLDEDGTLREVYYASFGRPRPQLAHIRPLVSASSTEAYDDRGPGEQVFRFALTDQKEAVIRLPFRLNDLDVELLKAQLAVIELQVSANKPALPIQFRPLRKLS